jgi:hypothetical protein|tara:strand:+ start:2071 stop:2277 length:207 start_codon:yes stop_codon:yes gene_type:complete
MQLENYRLQRKYTYEKLKNELNLSSNPTTMTIYRWCKGHNMPKKREIHEIIANTKNQVKLKDFFNGTS